eukprot:TRINITY_DN18234_c0_g1_i2.p2 TRINITY_DN18234_c0_g1~~TRINITY_DN18234_c0_g1_i2.p2  ORF type:complete len:233 (-),score=27.89 TRINITY_DN18234_c0_g1_i2:23-721(-)
MATLAMDNSNEIMGLLMKRSLEVVDEFELEEISDVIWASAYFQLWEDVQWWEVMLGKLQKLSEIGEPSTGILAQIYHAYLLSIADDVKTVTDTFSLSILQTAELAWLKSQSSYRNSKHILNFQESVFESLQQMQMDPYIPSQNSTDLIRAGIVVQFADCKFAIEVDGVQRFSKNVPYVALGQTRSRNKLLRHFGYIVVNVPFYEWPVDDIEAQSQYLLVKMQDCKENELVDY